MKECNDIFDYFNELKENDEEFKKAYELETVLLDLVVTLKNIREKKNMTQADVAKKSGLTRQMVTRIETYSNSPKLDTFIKYLLALDINLKDVLEKEVYA